MSSCLDGHSGKKLKKVCTLVPTMGLKYQNWQRSVCANLKYALSNSGLNATICHLNLFIWFPNSRQIWIVDFLQKKMFSIRVNHLSCSCNLPKSFCCTCTISYHIKWHADSNNLKNVQLSMTQILDLSLIQIPSVQLL